MKKYYRYDKNGYYLPGEDYIGDGQDSQSTDKPPLASGGSGMYKPRFASGNWIDEGQAPPPQAATPTVDEKVATLEKENARLQNSVSALEDIVVMLTMPT